MEIINELYDLLATLEKQYIEEKLYTDFQRGVIDGVRLAIIRATIKGGV